MVLVTGGLGFIGSHTAVELLTSNYDILIIDNLSNSNISVKSSIEKIVNLKVKFEQGDILDYNFLQNVFSKYNIRSVIHFAGLKSVSESVQNPLLYFENNVVGSLNLLKCMKEFNVKIFIFSSSATVYGTPSYLPYDENHPTFAINPYGRTKLIVEQILKDYVNSSDFKAISLRYFNPIGAHFSSLIGENTNGIPNNLIPYINKVILGEFDFVRIFGNDYETKDGTGVRDYIHIMDLARGHVLALDKLNLLEKPFFDVYNLGTGKGYSVLEVINAYSTIIGRDIPYKFLPRRDGDLGEYYSSTEKSKDELNFICEYDIFDMCRDSYNFIKKCEN